MTTDAPTDLNNLMDRDPLSLTAADVTAIVAYHRKNREGGPRPKKESGPSPKIDLGALKLTTVTPLNPIKRRV